MRLQYGIVKLHRDVAAQRKPRFIGGGFVREADSRTEKELHYYVNEMLNSKNEYSPESSQKFF